MKIYIAFKGEKYEGRDITGVYTTKELAWAALGVSVKEPHCCDETRARWLLDDHGYQFVEIEEHEVTGITIDCLEALIDDARREEEILKNLGLDKIIAVATILDCSRARAIEIIRENTKP